MGNNKIKLPSKLLSTKIHISTNYIYEDDLLLKRDLTSKYQEMHFYTYFLSGNKIE